MRHSLTVAAMILLGSVASASAVDGHGNADRPELRVPNTGSVSGGPAHRDDPRVSEAREVGKDGKPVHSANDGHAHGHSQDKK
ncbi:MAG: hypothetical protein K2Y56_06790 [Methylobacterium sp.]|uniref:hypothetical protein n=1 Tax=Methylobacterium sp. TaxID=409 RepID=UPI0025F84BFE|nr:hypothetical protein [Methylobacterium sp.]MBX9931229.1 hypothetical protein [Methylobacterium sp.]